MSHRPLATVCGLTIGDYLLWDWSLNANHAVLALVSGLTLPPLAIALVWLLVLTLVRFLASTSRDARGVRARRAARAAARVPATTPRVASPNAGAAGTPAARASSAASAAPASSSARASRKIAA